MLDDRRLGLQRMDNFKILEGLTGYRLFYQDPYMDWGNRRMKVRPESEWEVREHPVGWAHRPVVEGWRGHERLLRRYNLAICAEWQRRGFDDTMLFKFTHLWDAVLEGEDESLPWWYDDSLFHLAHQSYLVEKAPRFYAALFPGAPEGMKVKWTR